MDITRSDLEFEETQKILDLLWKIIEDLRPKALDTDKEYSVPWRLLEWIEDDLMSIDMKISRLHRLLEIDSWALIPLKKAEKIFIESLDTINKTETISI